MSNSLHVDAPTGVPFIDITREFDAPVARVFEAHAKPELVAQWMGPLEQEMDISEWDFTSGGRWSYVSAGPDGVEHAFRGMFHTVRQDEFAIQTFEYLGFPDVVAIESVTFEEADAGRTRIKIHSVYPTLEARDGMIASGMEGGMDVGYQRLDKLLA